jgi:F0F1-type ATP synthase gamma subunit
MTFDLNTITAFLTGSIATLIIREVFNQINKRIDFSRELKKITYQKKLEKAESAVAYYWTYLNKAIEIKKSIETIHKALNEIDEAELDVEIVIDTLTQNSKILTDLAGDKYFDINGIHLYFDLEDENS